MQGTTGLRRVSLINDSESKRAPCGHTDRSNLNLGRYLETRPVLVHQGFMIYLRILGQRAVIILGRFADIQVEVMTIVCLVIFQGGK